MTLEREYDESILRFSCFCLCLKVCVAWLQITQKTTMFRYAVIACQLICFRYLLCIFMDGVSIFLGSFLIIDSLPEWSKGVDSSSTSASCVGSNPTAVSTFSCASCWSIDPCFFGLMSRRVLTVCSTTRLKPIDVSVQIHVIFVFEILRHSP